MNTKFIHIPACPVGSDLYLNVDEIVSIKRHISGTFDVEMKRGCEYLFDIKDHWKYFEGVVCDIDEN